MKDLTFKVDLADTCYISAATLNFMPDIGKQTSGVITLPNIQIKGYYLDKSVLSAKQ